MLMVHFQPDCCVMPSLLLKTLLLGLMLYGKLGTPSKADASVGYFAGTRCLHLFCLCMRVLSIRRMSHEFGEQKKVGIGLIGFGFFFTFLGVILFFDRGLLALGNIIWLSGVALLLGWQSTWQLFTKRMNYKGSVSFFVGLFLIFVRWPIVGIILEIYGSIVLFGGFWPSVKVALYQIPVVGWFLQYPVMFLDRMRRSFG